MSRMRIGMMVTLVVLPLGSMVWAQDEPPGFGFLDEEVQLGVNPASAVSLVWHAPDIYDRLASYNAIIVEQPEIFLHPESKYKGIKPDAWKMLADDFMNAFADEIEKSYLVVSTPGEGVVHFRWAIGNLRLKKKWSKNPLKYTPVGATVNAVRKAVADDITKKVAMVEMTVEMELLDSQTGERLGAAREWRRQGEDPTSWKELDKLMRSWGALMACRLDNARLPEGERKNCLERV